MSGRIYDERFRSKLRTAEEAAALINPGDTIGFAGFTGSGYCKVVPVALADRIKEANARGETFKVNMFTGASTAPELDGAIADAGGVGFRTPYQSDPGMRREINAGTGLYSDIHLSHLAGQITQGFLGEVDVALIEATAITKDGKLVPSSSVGNNRVYLEQAKKIIIEVNSWQSEDLEGMHDIYYDIDALPPYRVPIPIRSAGDRIGAKYFDVDFDRVVAVVETSQPDRNTPFKPLDDDSKKIAGFLLDFLANEVKHGRLPKNLNPLQSGVGNIANAVLAGLLDSDLEGLTSYTEVIQDGMIDLIDAGKVEVASATAFSLSPEYATKMNENACHYREHIVLRPQDVSNHPEVIRRLGVIACNGMIEADIYGNVNSTHINGTRMMNGIGGSGDFTRNAYLSCFVSPAIARNGAISTIVPMVSHVDHTEHDTDVIITEQGLADLRGMAPRQRAQAIINNCVHPDYRDQLQDYFDQAQQVSPAQHTPHDLTKALSWHQRIIETGSMKIS